MKNKTIIGGLTLILLVGIAYLFINQKNIKLEKQSFRDRNCPEYNSSFFNDDRFYDPCGEFTGEVSIKDNFFSKNTDLSFYEKAYNIYCTRASSFPLGDGDEDCITKISNEDKQYLIMQSPWVEVDWKKGEIVNVAHHFEDGVINNFQNIFGDLINDENIYYALKDRSPSGYTNTNYTLIVLDPDTNILFITRYDS